MGGKRSLETSAAASENRQLHSEKPPAELQKISEVFMIRPKKPQNFQLRPQRIVSFLWNLKSHPLESSGNNLFTIT
jgi:hypothetical protein